MEENRAGRVGSGLGERERPLRKALCCLRGSQPAQGRGKPADLAFSEEGGQEAGEKEEGEGAEESKRGASEKP